MDESDLVINYNKTDLLLLDSANYSDEYPSLLMKSIMTRNNVLSKTLIKNGIGLKTRRKRDNMSAFLLAIEQNNLYIAKKLYKKCGNIEDMDINNRTALLIAIQNGALNIVDYLIMLGANVNHCSKGGYNSLIMAIISENGGNLTLIEDLLKSGVNVNIQDDKGCTSLMYAVKKGYKTIVEILLKNANPNIKDKYGYSAMKYAQFSRNDEIIALLLNAGCQMEVEIDVIEKIVSTINKFIDEIKN